MKTLFFAFFLTFGFSAQAVDSELLTITFKKGQLFANKGGIISPANESVADAINDLGVGKFECDAKFTKSSHKGTHVYTVYEIDNCY